MMYTVWTGFTLQSLSKPGNALNDPTRLQWETEVSSNRPVTSLSLRYDSGTAQSLNTNGKAPSVRPEAATTNKGQWTRRHAPLDDGGEEGAVEVQAWVNNLLRKLADEG